MRQITNEQVDEILKVLQEVPAKLSYRAITILLSLPEIKDKEELKGVVKNIVEENGE
jgi:hypothetical protein